MVDVADTPQSPTLPDAPIILPKPLRKVSDTVVEYYAKSVGVRIPGEAPKGPGLPGRKEALPIELTEPLRLDIAGRTDLTPYRLYVLLVKQDESGAPQLITSTPAPPDKLPGLLVGWFLVDDAGQLFQVGQKLTGNPGDLQTTTLLEEDFLEEVGVGWVLCDGRNVQGSRWAANTGDTNVPNIPVNENGERTYIKIIGAVIKNPST